MRNTPLKAFTKNSPVKTRPIATSDHLTTEGGGGKTKTQSELLLERQKAKFKEEGDKIGTSVVNTGSW